MNEKPKLSPAKITGFVTTAAGLVLWAVYMVLKYAMARVIQPMLWVALLLVLVGFVLRRVPPS